MNDTPTPPTFLSPVLENISAELKARPQWVAWKAVPNPKPEEKPRKVPINPKTGRGAASTIPGTWGSFDDAVRFYAEWKGKEHTHISKDETLTGPVAGIGIVLSTKTPLLAESTHKRGTPMSLAALS